MTSSDSPNVGPIFDIDKLQVTSIFLGIFYILFCVSATLKVKQWYYSASSPLFNRKKWTEQKLFHVFATIHLYVRAISFGLLSLFWLVDQKIWYPVVVVLFTLPEYFILSTYLLLVFYWLETYIFSHWQYLILSKKQFRTRWKYAFVIVSCIIYILMACFYFILMIKREDFEDTITTYILYGSAYGNFILPGFALFLCFYFGLYTLSGFPYRSSIAGERANKMNFVLFMWTFGRVARGVIILCSIHWHWQDTLTSTYQNMIAVATLAVTEFGPLQVVFDWSRIAVVLLGEGDRLMIDGPSNSSDAGSDTKQQRPSDSFISNGNGDMRSALSSDPEANRQTDLISLWNIPLSQIEFGKDVDWELGLGLSYTTSGVWKDPASGHSKPISIKAFRFQEMKANVIDELIRDLIENSYISHWHIATFLGVGRDDSTVFQFSEAEARSLFDLIQDSQHNFEFKFISRIAREIAEGMAYMHQFGQTHANLKSRNVLLSKDMKAKVSDIGIRHLKAYAEVVLVTRTATAWSAPEVLQGEPATLASDVYSFGIILWELLSRQIPYRGRSLDFIYDAVCLRGVSLPLRTNDNTIPVGFLQLVRDCCQLQYQLRPTFLEILDRLADLENGGDGTSSTRASLADLNAHESSSISAVSTSRLDHKVTTRLMQNGVGNLDYHALSDKPLKPVRAADTSTHGTINAPLLDSRAGVGTS